MPSYTYQRLNADDLAPFAGLLHIYNEVFDTPELEVPPADYIRQLLGKNDFIVFVAKDGCNQVIGGLTAHVLPSVYKNKNEVYVYDVAVLKALHRKGIGKRLWEAFISYCKDRGYHTLFVQADNTDAHAIAFYHATAGTPLMAVHFTYDLNP